MAELATLERTESQPSGSIEPRKLRCDVLRSIEQLMPLKAQWNRLWRHAPPTVPLGRFEPWQLWMEQFSSGRRWCVMSVFDNDQLVAALPLIEQRVGKFLRVGAMPCSQWSPGGDLLMDARYDLNELSRELLRTLPQLPWSVLWLDDAILDRSDWFALAQAARQAYTTAYHKRFEVAVLDTSDSFDSLQTSWSRNHRKKTSQKLRKLEKEHGRVRARVEIPTSPEAVEQLLRVGFDVEDRSWKGAAGTSTAQDPLMLEFYIRQAQLLAQDGELALAFLDVDQRPIAFEYGCLAKQVFHSFKVGYDADFATYSPGQLLVYLLLQQFCETPTCIGIDCLGPISDAMVRWRPRTYSTGRLVVGAGLIGRSLVSLYHWIRRKRLPADEMRKDT